MQPKVSASVSTVRVEMSETVPRQPAWIAATARRPASAIRMGRQSAVRIATSVPGRLVISASPSPITPLVSPSAINTWLE